MKLLRDFSLWRALRGLLGGRREPARRSYTVTVPAPRSPSAGNMVELRPQARAVERGRTARPAPAAIAGVREAATR